MPSAIFDKALMNENAVSLQLHWSGLSFMMVLLFMRKLIRTVSEIRQKERESNQQDRDFEIISPSSSFWNCSCKVKPFPRENEKERKWNLIKEEMREVPNCYMLRSERLKSMITMIKPDLVYWCTLYKMSTYPCLNMIHCTDA